MDKRAVIKLCKALGCCDACCLRYMGLKSPSAYENPKKYLLQFEEQPETNTVQVPTEQPSTTKEEVAPTPVDPTEGSTSPPHKRQRTEVCTSCLGLLQEASWEQCCDMVKEMLDKKGYECKRCACALSSPIAALLRETAIVLRLLAAVPTYEPRSLTALKEAWKWSLAPRLAQRAGKALDSGAVCPLLVTLNMEYPDDLQELEILKTLSPDLFKSRSKQKRRFAVEFTRRSVEQALEGVSLAALGRAEGWGDGPPAPRCRVACVSVTCSHAPVYLGGRYIKLSRELPQTPWLVNGVRMMSSSVQEIILEPLVKLYQIPHEEAEHRLKFMSAGREDVDVRCLRDGRPFAIEISDPRRQLSDAELLRACELISESGSVRVRMLAPVTKDDLSQLKKGEETKTKTYEALCIKLGHTQTDQQNSEGTSPVTVTPEDIARINAYRNTPAGDPARVVLAQRTPVRVLHRRPLLTRTRRILELTATAVEDHPQLFVVRIRTEAGTYVKEWAHGDMRRTVPALGDALGAPADILALDVSDVDLPWPPAPRGGTTRSS